MSDVTTLETVLKRDRAIVLGGLIGISALTWAYTAYMALNMGKMDMDMSMAMPQMQTWGVMNLLMLFVMWAVMMVAMMVPTAAPFVLIFATVNRQRRERADAVVPTAIFLLGYLIAWTVYSALATLAQWGLHSAALLSPMMVSTSPIFGGGLLVAAGVFQWTSLKQACLKHCRTPIGFLTTQWRDGIKGALIMGLKHGGFCVVCCWFLMALLFVLGVMNLLWMIAITAVVLVEKIVPGGHWIGRIAGLFFVVWGVWMAGSTLI